MGVPTAMVIVGVTAGVLVGAGGRATLGTAEGVGGMGVTDGSGANVGAGGGKVGCACAAVVAVGAGVGVAGGLQAVAATASTAASEIARIRPDRLAGTITSTSASIVFGG